MFISELVFIIGGTILSVALIPSVWSENKPDPKTSALSGIVLAAFTVNYFFWIFILLLLQDLLKQSYGVFYLSK